MEIKREGAAYIIVGVLVLVVILLFLFPPKVKFTGLAVFDQQNQTDFAGGTYDDVVYDANLSAVVLDVNKTYGEYTSKIFDSGNDSVWNNLTWTGQGNLSFAVRACGSSDCANESFAGADLNNLNLTAQYFQYQISFSEDPNITTSLTSVSIDYSVVVPAPAFSITVHSPLNQTYETTGVGLDVTSVGTADTWWYSLNSGNDTTFTPNTTITGVEGANTLTVYANESGGNVTSQNVSFSVVFPVCDSSHLSLCTDEASCTGIGKYWYGGSCNAGEESSGESESTPAYVPAFETTPSASASATTSSSATELSSGDIQTLSLNPGSSGLVSWNVTNTGTNHVGACKIRPSGEFVSWFSVSEDRTNLNIGDENEFVFNVIAPEDTGEGSYLLSVSLECFGDGTAALATKEFTVDVIAASESQEEIAAEEGTPFGGFAIFGEDGIGTGGIVILIVVVLVLTAILLISRYMKKSGKSLKDVLNIFNDFKLKFERS